MINFPVLCSFSFPCPKQWDDLSAIKGEESVRYCNGCSELVFLCRSYDELSEHVEQSHCVAIPCPVGDFTLGRVGSLGD